jgi:hypothetical protein
MQFVYAFPYPQYLLLYSQQTGLTSVTLNNLFYLP